MGRISRRPPLPILTGDAAADVEALSVALDEILREFVRWDNLLPGVSTTQGDYMVSTEELPTAAEKGFLVAPGMQGPPTGTPTDYNAGVPIVYDKSTNTLYVYDYTAAAWIVAEGVMKAQEFLANGSFTIPAGVTGMLVTAVGAGGGGSGTNSTNAGGGGGGGETVYRKPIVVTPGAVITVTIGVGGAAGNSGGGNGGNGTATTFGALVSADFGRGGTQTVGGAGGGAHGGAAQAGDAAGNNATQLAFAVGGGGGYRTSTGTGFSGGKGIGAGGAAAGGGGSWGAGGTQGTAAAANTGGGGGSGNSAATQAGGAGGSGYLLVEWFA